MFFSRFTLYERATGARPYALLLDPHEVADRIHKTADLRRILQLAHVVELVQAERLDAQAVLPLAAVHALVQAHLDRACRFCLSLGHNHPPRSPSCHAWRRCAPASPSAAGP